MKISDISVSDTLSSEVIERLSGSPKVIVKEVTESTNTDAKALISSGAEHGTVVISNAQTKGKGRFERAFYSPEGGVYFSIILKLNIAPSSASVLTPACAVCVCRAAESFSCIKPMIKWVNDIFVAGKKVCGISCEAINDLKSEAINFVVGVGVNFKTKTFPTELENIAGSLFSKNDAVSRNEFVSEIIKNILTMTQNIEDEEYMNEYRQRSFLIGEEIFFIENNKQVDALCLGIDEKGGLIVFASGAKRTLVSGEVSVRKKIH